MLLGSLAFWLTGSHKGETHALQNMLRWLFQHVVHTPSKKPGIGGTCWNSHLTKKYLPAPSRAFQAEPSPAVNRVTWLFQRVSPKNKYFYWQTTNSKNSVWLRCAVFMLYNRTTMDVEGVRDLTCKHTTCHSEKNGVRRAYVNAQALSRHYRETLHFCSPACTSCHQFPPVRFLHPHISEYGLMVCAYPANGKTEAEHRIGALFAHRLRESVQGLVWYGQASEETARLPRSTIMCRM